MTNRNSQPKSVGVVGDGDDAAILETIEDVFKIAIMDKEAQSIRTLEDAHSIICSKLPKKESEQTKCLSSMAYYRLNRALEQDRRADLSIRIEAPKAISPREFQNRLEERSGLKLPCLTTSSTWVKLIGSFILGTWAAGPIVFSGSYAIAIGILLFVLNFAIWRLTSSIDQRVWVFDGTLADLSRQASEKNIGKLVSEGGRWQETDVWASMTKIVSDETGFPAEKMRPAMTFID